MSTVARTPASIAPAMSKTRTKATLVAKGKAPAQAKAIAAAIALAKPVKPAKPPKPAKSVKAEKTEKAEKKPPKLRAKLVRDSFTMPEADFAHIAALKARAVGGNRETKKSELLRAGLHALSAMDTKSLLVALGQLDAVKIGRPKKTR